MSFISVYFIHKKKKVMQVIRDFFAEYIFFIIKTLCLDLESYSFYIPPLWYFKVALTQLNTKKETKRTKKQVLKNKKKEKNLKGNFFSILLI